MLALCNMPPFFPPSFVETLAEKDFQSSRSKWMNLECGSIDVHSLSSQSQLNANKQGYKGGCVIVSVRCLKLHIIIINLFCL